MPDIGEGVVEGEVIEWLKKIGDSIKQDEPVVVVMTDKATVELSAPQNGKLARQYYQPGQIAIRDKPLYDIETGGSAPAPAEVAPIAAPQPPKHEEKKHEENKSPAASALATPPVRKLARDLKINIDSVQGTGKDGRVLVEDLHKSTSAPTQSAVFHLPDDEVVSLIGIPHLMAKRMKQSKQVVPHFSYFEQVEVTRLIQLRQAVKKESAKENISLTYMPFFIRALSLALKQFPTVNGSLDPAGNQLTIHKQHNIGLAMSTPQGLIVAVLKAVQEMSLKEIIQGYESLKVKAQSGKLQPSDMKESTITISNFGALGNGVFATPIINYPESAILALAKIQKQPVVKDAHIEIRDILNVSWSFDHRFIDGDLATSFSRFYCSLLLNPASLL